MAMTPLSGTALRPTDMELHCGKGHIRTLSFRDMNCTDSALQAGFVMPSRLCNLAGGLACRLRPASRALP